MGIKSQRHHDAIHRLDAYLFGKKASYQGFQKQTVTKIKTINNIIIFLLSLFALSIVVNTVTSSKHPSKAQ